MIATYQQQTTRLRDQLVAFVTALWASLGSYRQPQMAAFTAQVVPVVEAAMRQMQALTSAYLATLTHLSGGSLTPTPTTPLTVPGVRNGAIADEVYGRPFHLVWRQLDQLPHEPGSIDQAIRSGLDRAVQTAVTDVQLAKTRTAQTVVESTRGVTGYRRVLEGAYSCGLCIVASTQRYHKGDLLPIHPGCDCGVLPIYGDNDPGHVVDPETLANVHQRVRERFAVNGADARAIPAKGLPDYRDVLVTHLHGEIGPVLGVRGQPFLGPNDL